MRVRNSTNVASPRRRLIGLSLLLMALTRVASANVMLSESFDYADGSLATVASNRWVSFSGTSGQVTVTNGRAIMNLANSEDVQTLIEPATDGVFAGFTLRFSTLPPNAGDYFVLFKGAGSSTDFRARVWALTNGAAGGKFRLGLSSTTTTIDVTNLVELSLNTDYRVVIQLASATGTARLWVDPQLETDPAITTAETPVSGTVAAFALRQGATRGQLALDDLVIGDTFAEVVSTNPPPPPVLPAPFLSVLTYNTHGNQMADWTTNSAQVRAIGRQVVQLDPDIICFQEMPLTNNGWTQVTNFVTAFRPGYYLATNSSDDGFIRSAILSRHPISRSQSWLHFTDLKPFGYTNTSTALADNFTRDLFEAEIEVPGFDRPLHVFTAHLKSGSGDDAQKRAAEASAVSNYFAAIFLPTHADRPYLLTGDFNEDIAVPASGSQLPIQRLVNDGTGLRLTTPRNPITGSFRTFSIRDTNGLAKRYDYILPGGLLCSNYAGAQVFRSDVLVPPPPGLFSSDSSTASDHLPVLMTFANPYASSFRVSSIVAANGTVALQWPSVSNAFYTVERSSNLVTWSALATHLASASTNLVFVTNAADPEVFFRVAREP